MRRQEGMRFAYRKNKGISFGTKWSMKRYFTMPTLQTGALTMISGRSGGGEDGKVERLFFSHFKFLMDRV